MAVGLSKRYGVLMPETALFACSKKLHVDQEGKRVVIPIPTADNATKGSADEFIGVF